MDRSRRQGSAAAVSQVVYSRRARQNLLAIQEFYQNHDSELAERALRAIAAAIGKVALQPKTGRPAYGSLRFREKVIAFGAQGFVALYEISRDESTVTVAAIRHQKQADYKKETE
jgi:plasmid stabilization system protein ParE